MLQLRLHLPFAFRAYLRGTKAARPLFKRIAGTVAISLTYA